MEASSEKATVHESLALIRMSRWENEKDESVLLPKHQDSQAEFKSDEYGEKFIMEDC